MIGPVIKTGGGGGGGADVAIEVNEQVMFLHLSIIC